MKEKYNNSIYYDKMRDSRSLKMVQKKSLILSIFLFCSSLIVEILLGVFGKFGETNYTFATVGLQLLIILSILGVVLFSILLKMKNTRFIIVRWSVLIFWFLVSAFFFPLFVFDIKEVTVPFCLLLYCAILTFAPILSDKELVAICSMSFLFIVISLIIFANSYIFILCTLLIMVASFVVTYFRYRSFIDNIKEFQKESSIDYLTSLSSSKYGFYKANVVYEICRRHKLYFTVAFIDVDFFKEYNEAYGSFKSDEVLVNVANCMQENFIRQSDVICRYSDDRFMICYFSENVEEAKRSIERLPKDIEQKKIIFDATEINKYLTISVGGLIISPKTTIDISFNDILHIANKELNRVKNSGRSQYSLKIINDKEKI